MTYHAVSFDAAFALELHNCVFGDGAVVAGGFGVEVAQACQAALDCLHLVSPIAMS